MLRRLAAVAAVVLLGGMLAACEVPAPGRAYTYRIATQGPVTADVGYFGQHVAATLTDRRGWSLGGAVSFQQTAGPADFTIWLATAGSVPSFGSGCSSQWSCRVGSNVVINEDRWRGATPTWPYGLDSYQHYVVNHELGHWLGLGHPNCTAGFGGRAPVMTQQSKGGYAMGACRFNVWPNPDELATVGAIRGVAPRSTGLANPDDPFGALEATIVDRDPQGRPVQVRVVGWAIDGDTTDPLGVVILVDGVPVDIVAADKPRGDLLAPFPYSGERHGYDTTVALAPDARTVCVVAGGVGAGHSMVRIGCGVVK